MGKVAESPRQSPIRSIAISGIRNSRAHSMVRAGPICGWDRFDEEFLHRARASHHSPHLSRPARFPRVRFSRHHNSEADGLGRTEELQE